MKGRDWRVSESFPNKLPADNAIRRFLYEQSRIPPPDLYQGAGATLSEGTRLTRIDAIWLYVAGVSLVFPIVKKNSERSANTSASVVSSLLLYVVLSSLTAFSLWTKVVFMFHL